MDESRHARYISGMRRVRRPPQVVSFSEVRHFAGEDCLHYESIAARGREYDWTIPAHRHVGLYQIHWLERGQVRATIDGREHALAAPALWLLAPGAVHALAYADRAAGRQVTVPASVVERALAGTPALAARAREGAVLDTPVMREALPECERLFAMIEAEFTGARPGRVEALGALAALLALWVLRRGGGDAASGPRALRDALTHRFQSLLELHFRRHQPLAFYAAELKVTPDHLSRVCRDTTGRSALQLVNERLFREARRALAYSDATVASIAADLGFADPAYFGRFFRRLAKKSPLEFRAAALEGVEAA
jgi:AraC family transcriptional activator of pobA